MVTPTPLSDTQLSETRLRDLADDIQRWSQELGFAQCGIATTQIDTHGERLEAWLNQGYHGEMDYMAAHGSKRYQPDALEPGTLRVISLRMNYYPEAEAAAGVVQPPSGKRVNPAIVPARNLIHQPDNAAISRYTLGRDYHKLIKSRLKQLASRITAAVPNHHYRIFVDSAPVLERALAEKAGLGWIGKNTMLIHPQAGSYFFLSEIYTDLPLPAQAEVHENRCGSCSACMDVCPTNAFVAPYVLDARKCISYLTIELKGAIPEALRAKMGNRIFGCDDCQLFCPWNKFTTPSHEPDFQPRHNLNDQQLIDLFAWDEATFLKRTEGSAIRRTGYENWLRNIAVALGNANTSAAVVTALSSRASHPSAIVREHVAWALAQHASAAP